MKTQSDITAPSSAASLRPARLAIGTLFVLLKAEAVDEKRRRSR